VEQPIAAPPRRHGALDHNRRPRRAVTHSSPEPAHSYINFLAIDYLAIDYLAIDYLAIDYLAIDYLAIDYLAINYLARFRR